jgi:hypothetical protein
MSRVSLGGLDAVAVGAPNLALGYLGDDDFNTKVARALADVEQFGATLFYVVKVQDYWICDATIYAWVFC